MSRPHGSTTERYGAHADDCRDKARPGPYSVVGFNFNSNDSGRTGTSHSRRTGITPTDSERVETSTGDSVRARTSYVPTVLSLVFVLFLLLVAVTLGGCSVEERRDIPAGAQAAVERVTDDIAAGRDAKVYGEAADEWRGAVSADENARLLSRVRERLGRVESRALHTGREQQSADAPLSGHAIELVYQTRFERGSAMEKFTLLERGGDWLLAGYSVNSDMLK
jgi:hypothetical protein